MMLQVHRPRQWRSRVALIAIVILALVGVGLFRCCPKGIPYHGGLKPTRDSELSKVDELMPVPIDTRIEIMNKLRENPQTQETTCEIEIAGYAHELNNV